MLKLIKIYRTIEDAIAGAHMAEYRNVSYHAADSIINAALNAGRVVDNGKHLLAGKGFIVSTAA